MMPDSFHRSFSVLFATLIVGTAACGSMRIQDRYTDLPNGAQQASHGTQDGFHRLSPYFGLAVSGRGEKRMVKVFHYPHGTSHKKLIGTMTGLTKTSADYGRRNQHFALSDDGMRLMYFHEAALQYAHLKKPNGLYLFRHGRGDTRLRATSVARNITQQDWKYLIASR